LGVSLILNLAWLAPVIKAGAHENIRFYGIKDQTPFNLALPASATENSQTDVHRQCVDWGTGIVKTGFQPVFILAGSDFAALRAKPSTGRFGRTARLFSASTQTKQKGPRRALFVWLCSQSPENLSSASSLLNREITGNLAGFNPPNSQSAGSIPLQ